MTEILDKYGLPGIVIGGLGWFVLYLMKQHKQERKEWQDAQKQRDEKSNEAINSNTTALTILKTLIETIKR